MKRYEDKGLESLMVWQKSLQFAVFVCKSVLPKLPDQEKYALSPQLRRAAQSIPANIAEGYGRFYYQEGIHFAYIARGSLEETYSHLAYALNMDYFTPEQFEVFRIDIAELRRLINGFINYLKKSKRGIAEPGSSYSSDTLAVDIDQVIGSS